MKKGYSKEAAWDMARHDIIDTMRKDFQKMYTKYLLDVYYLNHYPVHRKVKETLQVTMGARYGHGRSRQLRSCEDEKTFVR